MKFRALFSISALLPALIIAACSSAEDPTIPLPTDREGADAGRGHDGNAPGVDAADPGADGGVPEGGPNVTPGTLLKSGEIQIVGTSTDGFVAYLLTTGQTTSLEVVDVTSKQTTVVAASMGADDGALVSGKVVAFWTGVDKTTSVGTLGVWTKSQGTKSLGAGSQAGVFTASEDGSHIAYSTATTAQGLTTIALGNPGLSPASTNIVTNVGSGTAQAPCTARLEFVKNRLFTATCANQATTATVRSFSETGTATSLLTSAKAFFSVDSAGDKVLVRSSAGAAKVKTVPGNQATEIDTAVASGVISADGANIYYRTTALALKSASTTAPVTPTVLVPSGVKGLLGFSPDYKYVVLFTKDPDTQNPDVTRFDLELASTSASGTPTPLIAATTGDFVGFTSSSSHAIYMTDLGATGPAGNLKARPLAGGNEIDLAKGVFFAQPVQGTSKVVFGSNPQKIGDNIVIDVSATDIGAPKASIVIDQIDPSYELNGSQLFYTIAGKGLFVKAIP